MTVQRCRVPVEGLEEPYPVKSCLTVSDSLQSVHEYHFGPAILVVSSWVVMSGRSSSRLCMLQFCVVVETDC